MKTVITLTKVYSKTISFEVEKDLLIGKSEDEIADFLCAEYEFDESYIEKLFYAQNYEETSFDEDSIDSIDTDRYDIYQGEKHIYGGHL